MCLAVPMNTSKVTTTDLRRDFRTVLDLLLKGEHVQVSNYSRTCAVVVSPEWYAQATAALAQEARA
jgi:hypothetical protein